MATEETVDKKISRKTAKEWRKDLLKRSLKNLPDPHREGKAREGVSKRFYKAIPKFRGIEKAMTLGSYLKGGQKPTTTSGPEIKKPTKKLTPLKSGGRAAFKHGKYVKVATPHADIAKYVEKDSSKSPEHYRKEGSTLKMGKKRGGRRMGRATRDPGKKFKVKIPAIELVKEGPRNEKFGLRIRKSLGGAATHGFNTKILRS